MHASHDINCIPEHHPQPRMRLHLLPSRVEKGRKLVTFSDAFTTSSGGRTCLQDHNKNADDSVNFRIQYFINLYRT